MYAHLINQTTISTNPPRSAVIDGAQVVGELPESYLNSQDWYRLTETPMPENPQEGYHYEQRFAYDSDEAPTRIVQSWVEVEDQPPPPRTFSKFKLKLAIASAGYLDEFTAMLSSVEVAPGYMGDEAFKDAVTLDEDNEKFKDAVKAVKSQFGLTDAEVEEILSASVAE